MAVQDPNLCNCGHRHVSPQDECDYPGCGCTIFEPLVNLDHWSWPGANFSGFSPDVKSAYPFD